MPISTFASHCCAYGRRLSVYLTHTDLLHVHASYCLNQLCLRLVSSGCHLNLVYSDRLMSQTEKKMCRGCGAPVAKPIKCGTCGLLSHPACLSRCGHPWNFGELLDCSTTSASSRPSVPPDSALTFDNIKRLISEQITSLKEDFKASYFGEINSLRRTIEALTEKVARLEAHSMNTASSSGASTHMNAEETLSELNERQRRSRNLLIFGHNETESTTMPGVATNTDTNAVKDILKTIFPANYDNIRTYRIGKKRDDKPRPVCVVLSSPDDVVNILKRKSEYTGAVKFSQDRTPLERKYLDNLRSDLKKLHDKGDTNKTIRYRNGIPSIVTFRSH